MALSETCKKLCGGYCGKLGVFLPVIPVKDLWGPLRLRCSLRSTGLLSRDGVSTWRVCLLYRAARLRAVCRGKALRRCCPDREDKSIRSRRDRQRPQGGCQPSIRDGEHQPTPRAWDR